MKPTEQKKKMNNLSKISNSFAISLDFWSEFCYINRVLFFVVQ